MTESFPSQCNVAILDDDSVYRHFVSMLLAKQGEISVFEASNEGELADILDQQSIDCIILDYNLGVDNGLAVKERLGRRSPPSPPVVMLTGDGRERTVIKALRLGIDDYVPKNDLKAGDLVAAIRRVVQKGRSERLARAENRRMVQASGLDPVTGLLGRDGLDQRLTQLAALPAYGRAAYALIVAELGEFADISAKFGLKSGDEVLRAFGEKLQSLIRTSDVCGRYADGMFLAIVDTRSTSEILTGVCRRFADHLTFRIDLATASLSLTGRVAGFPCSQVPPNGIVTAGTLVESARNALAGDRGEGRFVDAHETEGESQVSPEMIDLVASHPTSTLKPAADQLRTVDRRREPRQRVLKQGRIVLGNNTTVDCIVRNISKHGAGLRISAPFPVPGAFDLEVVGTGVRRRVRVQWQAGNDLGVAFAE